MLVKTVLPLAPSVTKSLLRTCNARPYRFGGSLNIIAIEEGFPIPTNLRKKREAERLPYGQNIKIRTYFVGDDILGVPFIKVSLCFARAVGDACPYKVVRYWFFDCRGDSRIALRV